ncbi:glycosyltransferase [Streptomyces sp. NPDC096310]|uniref:glycosyltransferase n=1 Tax=Streptomyces sp. NPDC096310 TaxID=3366082 RepID=UPI0037F59BFB
MRPHTLAVIIPAHNEEALLSEALEAIRTASRHPALQRVRVLTVVAADSCVDGTAATAWQTGAQVVPVSYRNPGRARAAAADLALKTMGGPAGCWLASTDADSTVPPSWLAFQYARACEGWDAVVGTVTVTDWPPHVPGLAGRHHRHYDATRPAHGPWLHPHVHGANLGVRAEAYTAVGGFPPLGAGEDHGLVAALSAGRHRILRTSDCPVVTSGRLHPRARGGFGNHLARLALEED